MAFTHPVAPRGCVGMKRGSRAHAMTTVGRGYGKSGDDKNSKMLEVSGIRYGVRAASGCVVERGCRVGIYQFVCASNEKLGLPPVLKL